VRDNYVWGKKTEGEKKIHGWRGEGFTPREGAEDSSGEQVAIGENCDWRSRNQNIWYITPGVMEEPSLEGKNSLGDVIF